MDIALKAHHYILNISHYGISKKNTLMILVLQTLSFI